MLRFCVCMYYIIFQNAVLGPCGHGPRLVLSEERIQTSGSGHGKSPSDEQATTGSRPLTVVVEPFSMNAG